MYKGEPAKVERLTLQQAAGRLGISKEAVRQQVEQGILPHGEWLDGGVYVCIDADTDTGNNEKYEKSGHSSPIRRLLSLTNLSTFVTVLELPSIGHGQREGLPSQR
jgi:hypothetical protein